MSLAILGGQALYANSVASGPGSSLQKIGRFSAMYTGYNFATNTWQLEQLAVGYGPWLVKRFVLPLARPGNRLGRMLPVSLS